MRKLLNVSLALLATASAAARAQTPADTATAYRHQLGLTASPVLDGFFKNNRALPLGILYKRQVRPNRAFRVRLVGQYSRYDTTNAFAPAIRNISRNLGPDTRAWSLAAYLGYEWQKRLSKRFSWAYGAEVGLGISRNTLTSSYNYPYRYNLPGVPDFYTNITHSATKGLVAQVRPYAAVHYHITKSISVFGETAINLSYQRRSYRSDSREVFLNGEADRVGQDTRTTNSLNLNWRPIQLIGIAVTR